MNDDASTTALQEIAALLRRRVEQEDEEAEMQKAARARNVQREKEIAERMDTTKMWEESRLQMEEQRKRSELRADEYQTGT